MYVMAILNMLTCYDQYAAAASPGLPTRYNLNTGITEVHVVFPDACTHAASCPLFIHDEPCLSSLVCIRQVLSCLYRRAVIVWLKQNEEI